MLLRVHLCVLIILMGFDHVGLLQLWPSLCYYKKLVPVCWINVLSYRSQSQNALSGDMT